MILSDKDIRAAIKSKDIILSSPSPLYIGPASLDLHLKGTAKRLKKGFDVVLDCHKDNSEHFEEFEFEDLVVEPNDFFILSTIEQIGFSRKMAGFIQGRSSLARLGLNIHAAGFFDPGFFGTATLEVSNFTSRPIVIYNGMRICQMVFAPTSSPVEVSYADKKDQKYNGQIVPTLSRIHQEDAES